MIIFADSVFCRQGIRSVTTTQWWQLLLQLPLLLLLLWLILLVFVLLLLLLWFVAAVLSDSLSVSVRLSVCLYHIGSVQFSTIVYVRPILIASSYHERASSRHRPCQVVQISDGDRSRMMMTSHCERLLEVSSRLWDRTQRSCVIHIVTVDSAGFSSHGVSTTVDTSDQMLLTPGWHHIILCRY